MQSGQPQPKGTYALISLGCPKNLVDSERMAGLLGLEGYRMVAEPEGADFVVINTCGFIGNARDESHSVIREMLDLKRRGSGRRGHRGRLPGRARSARALGNLSRDRSTAGRVRAGRDRRGRGPSGRGTLCAPANRQSRRPACATCRSARSTAGGVSPCARAAAGQTPSAQRITPRHLAFLKIAEGCNRLCSFCSIPKIRGPYASKPIEQVLAEAEELVADGARELILVAQDTSYYGMDLYGRPRLAELLTRLDQLDGLAWIRLMYLYPRHIDDELIDAIAGAKRIVPYLDLPLQHIDDDILRRMRRRINRDETERLLDRLRAADSEGLSCGPR